MGIISGIIIGHSLPHGGGGCENRGGYYVLHPDPSVFKKKPHVRGLEVLKVDKENYEKAVNDLYRTLIERHNKVKEFNNLMYIKTKYTSVILIGEQYNKKSHSREYVWYDVELIDTDLKRFMSSVEKRISDDDNVLYVESEENEGDITLYIKFRN